MDNSEIVIKEKKIVSRTAPFCAQITERLLLTKTGSSKTTYHITLDITGSEVHFKSGDSLGIYGQNDPKLVDKFMEVLQVTGEESIIDPKSQELITLRTFLTNRANLGRSNSNFLRWLSPMHELLQKGNEEPLRLFLQQHDPLDLLTSFIKEHQELDLLEFVKHFSPLLPRFYSIASSLVHSPDKVDLTVALSSYIHRGETRYGVASHFLCKLAKERSTSIPIYVQPTAHFTLPANSLAPMIMIGPGTGVAPFRGFMQERLATAAKGKNWLFFGECNQATDFFYEEFWKDLSRQGFLHELDLAFSRDQVDKIYVQHRLLERQETLWAWMQEGAIIYVCGDAERMARAVEETWVEIFRRQGNMTLEEAKAAIRTLKKEKRYLVDVY